VKTFWVRLRARRLDSRVPARGECTSFFQECGDGPGALPLECGGSCGDDKFFMRLGNVVPWWPQTTACLQGPSAIS
jgi:hypothetical protein